MELLELAKNVRRGVKFLDSKIPNWRGILRKHEAEFDFADGSYCVLGTLEHHAGRTAVAKLKRGGIDVGNDYPVNMGFDGGQDYDYSSDVNVLSDLWRAEFEHPKG